MLIDTHAHLNLVAFEKDRNKVIKKCLDNNVLVVNVGSNLENSKKAVEIAGENEGMWASVGLHPINLDTGLVKIKEDKNEGKHFERYFDYEEYKKLASFDKVVAIGEIGLDYYWKPKTTRKKELFKQKQRELLKEELRLAKELDLPVIFHCRMAHRDLIDFLSENSSLLPKKAVAHSFVGGLQELNNFLELGFYIGFNAIVFKDIEGIDFEKVIKAVPLDRVLIETDCPYLIPPGVNARRNEPIFVRHVAEHISRIKKTSFEKLSDITTQNARDLFNI